MKISRYTKCVCGFEYIEYHYDYCPACKEPIEWEKTPPGMIDNIEPVKLGTLQSFDVFMFNGEYYMRKFKNNILSWSDGSSVCMKLPDRSIHELYNSLYVYPVKDIELKVKLK